MCAPPPAFSSELGLSGQRWGPLPLTLEYAIMISTRNRDENHDTEDKKNHSTIGSAPLRIEPNMIKILISVRVRIKKGAMFYKY